MQSHSDHFLHIFTSHTEAFIVKQLQEVTDLADISAAVFDHDQLNLSPEVFYLCPWRPEHQQ